MTYEQFLDDPFGKKKIDLEDFYAAQRKSIKTFNEKEETIDKNNPFGQLVKQVNLADKPD